MNDSSAKITYFRPEAQASAITEADQSLGSLWTDTGVVLSIHQLDSKGFRSGCIPVRSLRTEWEGDQALLVPSRPVQVGSSSNSKVSNRSHLLNDLRTDALGICYALTHVKAEVLCDNRCAI